MFLNPELPDRSAPLMAPSWLVRHLPAFLVGVLAVLVLPTMGWLAVGGAAAVAAGASLADARRDCAPSLPEAPLAAGD